MAGGGGVSGVVVAAVIDGRGGVGQHRGDEAFGPLQGGGLVGPGAVRQARHVRACPRCRRCRGAQVLLELAAVHLGQQLRVVHLLHAIRLLLLVLLVVLMLLLVLVGVLMVVWRRGQLASRVTLPSWVLAVVHGQRVAASHVGG